MLEPVDVVSCWAWKAFCNPVSQVSVFCGTEALECAFGETFSAFTLCVFPPYNETERLGEAPVVGLPPGEIKL